MVLLARSADGSLRDALSLLDQAIAYCGGTVTEEKVALMLGTIDRVHVSKLLKLLAASDANGVIGTIAEIDEQFPDYGRLLDDLARFLQRVAVYQVVGDTDSDDDASFEALPDLAETLSAADVQLFYQTAIIGRRDLHLAPDPRSGAEMTLLRMLAFRPATADTSVLSSGSPGARTRPESGRGTAVKSASNVALATNVVTAPTGSGSWHGEPEWNDLISDLGLTGAVRMLASNCAFLKRDGDTLFFGLDPRSESLLTRQRKDGLASIVSKHLGEQLSIDISIVKVSVDESAETPVQEESRLADEKVAAARASLESDPNVQALKKLFGAELKADSIELINKSVTDGQGSTQ
jgi:DNA polymerase-3 subunit gamma/tau